MTKKIYFKLISFALFSLVTNQAIYGATFDKKTILDTTTKIGSCVQSSVQRYAQAFTSPHLRANTVDMAIYTGTALVAAIIIYKIYKHIKHNLNTDKPVADSSNQPVTITTVVHNTTPVIYPYQWHWTYNQPVIIEHTHTHAHYTHYIPEQKQAVPQPTYERTTQSIIEQTQLTPNIEQKAAEFGKIKLPSIFE